VTNFPHKVNRFKKKPPLSKAAAQPGKKRQPKA